MANKRRVNEGTLELLRSKQRERLGKVERTDPPVLEPPPRSANDLCVGTILVNGNRLNLQWLDLQLRYLKATTGNFDHFTYVSNGDYPQAIRDMGSTPLSQCPRCHKKDSQAHIFGLTTLKNFFVERKDDYKHFLFLDMDAFPIKKNWQSVLDPRLDRQFEVCTLIRPENLEQRVHCSVVYVKAEALAKLDWQVGTVGNDLIGNKESDVKLVHYQDELRNKVFVLVRSNKVNVHPLLCGVYYDMFYHHGCGSGRNYNMRSRPYWGHVVDKNLDVMGTIRNLMDKPSEFVSELAGWCPDQYPRV